MLFTDIKAAVVAYTKSEILGEGTLLETIINREYYQLVRTHKLPEFKQNRTSATMSGSSTTGLIVFGATGKLLDIDDVRFVSGGQEWMLSEIDGRVPPSPIYGKPRAYRRIGSADAGTDTSEALYLEPFDTIVELTDKCYVTWWRTPNPLSATAGSGVDTNTAFANHTLDTELIDRSCAAVFVYYKKESQAQLLLSKYAIPAQTKSSPSAQ